MQESNFNPTQNQQSSPITSGEPAGIYQKKTFINKKIIIIIAVLTGLIITALFLIYFFLILPRQKITDQAKTNKESLKTLSESTRSVKVVMDRMYTIITENSSSDDTALEISGLIIKPNTDKLLVQNVLGVQSKLNMPSYISDITRELVIRTTKSITDLVQEQILGIQTASAENPTTQRFRLLKDETIKVEQYIKKGQEDLAFSKSNYNDLISLIPSPKFKDAASFENAFEKTSEYFSESSKISEYYANLSEILISMNSKVTAFQTSISQAGRSIASIRDENISPELADGKVREAEIFMNEASLQAEDITKLISRLKNIPGENLPQGSDEYHAHNIAVLESVLKYFNSINSVMKGYTTSLNFLSVKAKTGELTNGDVRSVSVSLLDGIQKAQDADTQFASELLSFLNEEYSLTVSFWQNNKTISKGAEIEGALSDLTSRLEKIEVEFANKIT